MFLLPDLTAPTESESDHWLLETRRNGQRHSLTPERWQQVKDTLHGGSTGDGSPYLVMEYVDGLPIDDYCDRRTQ